MQPNKGCELDNVKSNEGIKFYSDTAHGTPVYRLYNPAAGVGAHFYTTNLNEKNHLVSVGWKYEGISWYGLA
jgi:hypothetical protein